MKTKQAKLIGSSTFDVGRWLFDVLPSSQAILGLLLPLLLLTLPATGQAQFIYTTHNGTSNDPTFYVGNPVAFSADFSDGNGNRTNVDGSRVGAVGNSPYQLKLAFTNGPSGPQLGVPMNEWAVSQFQGEAEDGISHRLGPPISTEAADKPAVLYRPGLELRTVTPINVVPSKMYPGIEYSGILVQAAKSNPLQLINPFAPALYGNGEANVVRHFVTREVEGLKLWRISF